MKLTDWLYNLRKPEILDDKELQQIEARLHETLKAPEISTAFLANLRVDLLNKFPNMESTIAESRHQAFQTGLLVTSGIIGSLLVVLTGIRGLISIIGVGGLLISIIKQNT